MSIKQAYSTLYKDFEQLCRTNEIYRDENKRYKEALQEAAKEIERLKVLIELSHKAILSEQSEEEYDPAAYGRWYDAYQQFKTKNNL